MNKRHFNNAKGFTLVEILIAVLIFSIVISTLFSSFNAFVFSSKTVKEDIIHNEKITTVFKRITMDLEALYVLQPPRYRKPEFNSDPDPYRFFGKENAVGQQEFSSMTFASLAHATTGSDQRTGVAGIVYYVKENNNHTYDLHRTDTLLPFSKEPESCYDPILCKDISGFEIIYTDFNGNEYKYWNSDDEEFSHIFPSIINVALSLGIGEKIRTYEISFGPITGRDPIE